MGVSLFFSWALVLCFGTPAIFATVVTVFKELLLAFSILFSFPMIVSQSVEAKACLKVSLFARLRL